jgi:AAA+ ATPase superfamily predicted ATPase
LFKSKEKHLKQGEKISNLENASFNLIHIPLTICKRFLEKNFTKNFAKTKLVVQAWSKILNKKKAIHAYLIEIIYWFNSKQPLHLPYAN